MDNPFVAWVNEVLSISPGGNHVRLTPTDWPILLTPEQADELAERLVDLAEEARRNVNDAYPGFYPQKGKA